MKNKVPATILLVLVLVSCGPATIAAPTYIPIDVKKKAFHSDKPVARCLV
jgi:hypothetical protein